MIKVGKRRYLGDAHKKYSERCQAEVKEMQKHPLTHQEFLEQIERLRGIEQIRIQKGK